MVIGGLVTLAPSITLGGIEGLRWWGIVWGILLSGAVTIRDYGARR